MRNTLDSAQKWANPGHIRKTRYRTHGRLCSSAETVTSAYLIAIKPPGFLSRTWKWLRPGKREVLLRLLYRILMSGAENNTWIASNGQMVSTSTRTVVPPNIEHLLAKFVVGRLVVMALLTTRCWPLPLYLVGNVDGDCIMRGLRQVHEEQGSLFRTNTALLLPLCQTSVFLAYRHALEGISYEKTACRAINMCLWKYGCHWQLLRRRTVRPHHFSVNMQRLEMTASLLPLESRPKWSWA